MFYHCIVLQGLLEHVAPMRKIRVKQNVSPWAANADVTAAHHLRDKLHRRAIATTGDPVIWQQYRSSRNKVNKLLRNAKCTYLSRLGSSKQGQSAKFWSYFRHLSCRGVQTSLSLENLDFTSDDLNQHFLSVADKIVQGISSTNISPLSFITVNVPVFQFTTVSDASVISIISNFDTNKAAGVDGIPVSVRFIKQQAKSLVARHYYHGPWACLWTSLTPILLLLSSYSNTLQLKAHPASIGRLIARLVNHA